METIADEKFIIETKRLILKPIKVEDAELLWPHVTNPKITQFLTWDPHESIEQTRNLIVRLIEDKKNGKGITWSIFHKENNDYCGMFSIIDIMRTHRSVTYDRGELACWCVPKYQIDRIMDEAGVAINDFAFDVLKLHKVRNGHLSLNVASERLITKLHYKFYGEEKEAYQKNGVWYDIKWYQLLREEYNQIRNAAK
jgi:ribosomal-protein-alanine N-acetyltransferase